VQEAAGVAESKQALVGMGYMKQRQRGRVITIIVGMVIGMVLMTLFYLVNAGS
jgi:hypothetical protein